MYFTLSFSKVLGDHMISASEFLLPTFHDSTRLYHIVSNYSGQLLIYQAELYFSHLYIVRQNHYHAVLELSFIQVY